MSHPLPQTYPIVRSRIFAVRTARPAFLLIVALLFVASLFTLFTFTPRAFADELAPEAPGSIAGAIRNAQGEPQAGIEVMLYKVSPFDANSWTPIRTNRTGIDGIYRFTLLSVGSYRIGVSDPKHVYARTYYPAAASVYQGADITVVGNQFVNIDLTLQPSGRILGSVAATAQVTISQFYVMLLQDIGPQGNANWQAMQSLSVISASGTYTFTDLGAGNYRVCANGYSSNFSIYECYDDVYDVNRATDLVLNAGATISNVALLLGDSADYAQISGHVSATNQASLANIDVYAVPTPFQSYNDLPFPPSPYYGYYYNYFLAQTDSQGNYQFPMLTAGKYTIYFNDPTGQFTFEHYNNVYRLEEAVVLEVAPKQVMTNVNAQLEPGGRITGIVTIFGTPAAQVSILAELKTPSGWRAVRNGKFDPNNGYYQLDGLPAGSYRVQARGAVEDGYSGYYYVGYFGGDTLETAAEIPVAVGETKQADITLSGGPRFDGSLTGRITANGAPLAGAKVTLYRGDYICCNNPILYSLVSVMTDANGRYTVNGLTASSLRIEASDPAGIYATTYYTGQAIPALSTIVNVSDSAATTGVDLDLPLGGAISGRVTLRNGEPVPNLYIAIYSADVIDPNYNAATLVSSYAQTDGDGRYTIKGLHAGNYYVCFTQSRGGSNQECYGAATIVPGNTTGRIQIVAGTTKTGIDLLWGPDLPYYLPFIAQ